METTGRKVVSREDVPVRKSEYDNGTVSYDLEHEGHRARLTFRSNGAMRLHLPDKVVRIDGLRHSQEGWTNIELVPVN